MTKSDVGLSLTGEVRPIPREVQDVIARNPSLEWVYDYAGSDRNRMIHTFQIGSAYIVKRGMSHRTGMYFEFSYVNLSDRSKPEIELSAAEVKAAIASYSLREIEARRGLHAYERNCAHFRR